MAYQFAGFKSPVVPAFKGTQPMRPDPSRYARMSDPDLNYHFSRGWSERAMSSRQIERASEIAAANGNMRLADRLAWMAHSVRVEAGVRS